MTNELNRGLENNLRIGGLSVSEVSDKRVNGSMTNELNRGLENNLRIGGLLLTYWGSVG